MGKFEKANRPQAQQAAKRAEQQRRERRAQQPVRQRPAAPARPSGAEPTRAQNVARKKQKKRTRLPVVIGILCAAVVIIGCVIAFLWIRGDDGRIAKNVFVAGVDLSGMTKEEAAKALSNVTFDDNMNVRLYTRGETFSTYVTTYDVSKEQSVDIYGKPLENVQQTVAIPKDEKAAQTDADAPLDENGKPYLLDRKLTLLAQDVGATLDVNAAVEAAYQYGRTLAGKKDSEERMDLDVSKHMTVNDTYIREVLTSYLEDTICEGTKTTVEEGKTSIDDADGNPKQVDCLKITLGTLKRDIDIDALYGEIVTAYASGNFDLQYVYQEELPEPIDLDKLYRDYDCTAPVNAKCDEETFAITDGKDGFGFRMADAVAAFEGAKPGETVTLTLTELKPQFTRETLEKQLFCDTLSSFDSPHVWNPTRTHNLELACEAIDGYILKPGATFSYNEVVGERTAEKGYGEAGVYVGGKTENQLGGGVCQVASTLFYCTLKANLEVVERAEHQFTPSYVPWGMDATVYWGYLDYKFRNNTAFPIRIDASVSDGYVHVRFVGTETKEYTVKLDYEVTAYFSAQDKIIDISPDMPNYSKYSGYSEGDVIQTAYDGANVTTYMYKYDMSGKLISTEIVCYSQYDRRDREIAHLVKEEETTEPTTEPTTEAPTEAPTDPPTTEAPTDPPTEAPTDPPTDAPTDEPTEYQSDETEA